MENIQRERNKTEGHHNHGLKDALVKEENGKTSFRPIADDTYLSVEAETQNGISSLTVTAYHTRANGSLEDKGKRGNKYIDADEDWWTGPLELDATKNANGATYTDKYATIDYEKPRGKWHLILTNVAVGSKITGLKSGDFVNMPDTGDDTATLREGENKIYQFEVKGKKKIQKATNTVTVTGSNVQVKTKGGLVTYLAGLKKVGDHVTIKEGNKTSDFIFEEGGVVATYKVGRTITAQKKIFVTDGKDVMNADADHAVFIGKEAMDDKHHLLKVGDTTINSDNAALSVSAKAKSNYTISGITDESSFTVGDDKFHRYHNLLFEGDIAGKTDEELKGKEILELSIGAGKAKNLTSAQLAKVHNDAKHTSIPSWSVPLTPKLSPSMTGITTSAQ